MSSWIYLVASWGKTLQKVLITRESAEMVNGNEIQMLLVLSS